MPAITIRLVTRDSDGSIRTRDFANSDLLNDQYEQVGIDDCSTELTLRGLPVFRGLVGPIPEGKGVARYETADVFEALTKEWAKAKVKRRRRRASQPAAEEATPMGLPVVGGMTTTFGGSPVI